MVLVDRGEIEDFVEEASELLGDRLDEVILFGSYARGDHVPGSDVDLLFLVSEGREDDLSKLLDLSGDYFLEKDVVFSPKVVEKEVFEKRTMESAGFYREVDEQGVRI